MAPLAGVQTIDTPTVFVVDDDAHMQKLLRTVISSSGFLVETFHNPQTFLDALAEECPGCIVAELLTPGMSGLELQRCLSNRGYLLPFIMLSGYADVTSAVTAMKAGAVDFIQKPFPTQNLLDAIREAIRRNAILRIQRAERTKAVARLAPLTAREREVLGLLMTGQSNKVIATRLGISDNTVENHRASIMKKTRAAHLVELVRLVLTAQAE